MTKILIFLLWIVCLGGAGCGNYKSRSDISNDLGPHLVAGKTTRQAVVKLMREKNYQVIDEPGLRNVFDNRECEYMPASYVEEGLFGRYITVIDYCFDPETKVLETYRINETAGRAMFLP